MNLRKPFNGNYPITQKFGDTYTSASHTGIDYALPLGTPVLAAADGSVTTVGFEAGGFGNYVVITHPDGSESFYCHLQTVMVRRGDNIYTGISVGQSGSTGKSTGPHLHFEYRINGKPVNPEPFLASTPTVKPEIDADGDGLIITIVDIANIRDTPNGKLIGTLSKGTILKLTGDEKTENNLEWVEVNHNEPFWIAKADSFGTQMLGDE